VSDPEGNFIVGPECDDCGSTRWVPSEMRPPWLECANEDCTNMAIVYTDLPGSFSEN
jgi:hypothetical protein